jgi:hypothetical protein
MIESLLGIVERRLREIEPVCTGGFNVLDFGFESI